MGGVALTGSTDNPAYATTDDSGNVITEGATADNYNIKWDGSTLTLSGATITGKTTADTYQTIGIYASSSSGDVSLKIELQGENMITSDGNGIYVYSPENGGNASLTITDDGNGSLTASGYSNGIQVQSNSGNATLTIQDADVEETVTAPNGVGVSVQAGESSSASLSVEGGSLTATGTGIGSGIHFQFGSGDSGSGTPSLTVSDNTIVWANGRITSNSSPVTPSGTGIVFNGNEGTVYGDVTLQEDLTIGKDESLTIPDGASLTVPEGITLTNYGTITGEVNGTVLTPATVAVSISPSPAAYGSTVTLTATITKATDGSVTFYRGDATTGTALNSTPVNVDNGIATAAVQLTGEDWKPNSETPYTITAVYSGGTGLLGSSNTTTLTVNKAMPTSPTAPTGTTEVTINSITLTTITPSETDYGTIQYGYITGTTVDNWQDEPQFTGLSVGTLYTFYTRYKGNDYYNASSASNEGLTVYTLPEIITTSLEDGTVGEAYSATLAVDVALGTTVTWSPAEGSFLPDGLTLNNNGEICGIPTTAGDFTFIVQATIGSEDNTASNTKELSINIAKGTPTYQTPTGLTATYGQTLADVEFPEDENGTWKWENDKQSVGDVGIKSFKATFTPTDNNYNPVTESIEITVKQATLTNEQIQAVGETTFSITQGETASLTVNITDETIQGGSWTWASSDASILTVTGTESSATVTTVNLGTATVTATYKNTNYTGSVTFTITVEPIRYTVKLEQTTGGTISASPTSASEGIRIKLTYREDSNYDFMGWTVTADDGTTITVSSNSFTMPASDVTVKGTFRYDPPYVPSYYDIYFDGNENDSVHYNCSTTTIREGGTFSFTVEVAEGYDPETLVVEYKRGRAGSWREVTPNSSDRYRITNVHADIYVRSRVEPIEDPTAIEEVGDGKSTIRSDGKRIRIHTAEPQTMHIFNVGDRLVRTAQLPAGDTEVTDLPQGFYIIVLSDGTRAKTLIN